MCTHSIDDLLPHAPLHYASTGEMVKGSYYISGKRLKIFLIGGPIKKIFEVENFHGVRRSR